MPTPNKTEIPKTRIEQFRDSVQAMRELLIILVTIALVLLLAISPKSIKDTLDKAGIKSIGNIELQAVRETSEETKKALQEVSMLQDSLTILKDKLTNLMANAEKPETREKLADIQTTISQTSEKAYALDRDLKSSAIRQQKVINQYDESVSQKKETGWIFLGQVNEAQTEWINGLETIE